MERIVDSYEYYSNIKTKLLNCNDRYELLSDIINFTFKTVSETDSGNLFIISGADIHKDDILSAFNCVSNNLKQIHYFCADNHTLLEYENPSWNQPLLNIDEILKTKPYVLYIGSLNLTDYKNKDLDKIIYEINKFELPVISVSVPYGINPVDASISEPVLKSDFTLCLFFKMQLHVLPPTRFYCGKCVNLSKEQTVIQNCLKRFVLEFSDVKNLIGNTKPNSNKSTNGRVLIISGSESYPGAAIMCIGAAVSAGAGLTYAFIPETLFHIVNHIPDAIYIKAIEKNGSIINDETDTIIKNLLIGKDAVCLGPGINYIDYKDTILHILNLKIPTVLDAGALNYISKEKSVLKLLHKNVVITPHPGELSRIINVPVETIIKDPVFYAENTAKKLNCTVLLKGATSCISNGIRTCLNITGDEGLAKGGSGDVLSGILASFLAAGMNTFYAAACASFILGTSAEKAYEILNKRALLHMDIIDCIKDAIRFN